MHTPASEALERIFHQDSARRAQNRDGWVRDATTRGRAPSQRSSVQLDARVWDAAGAEGFCSAPFGFDTQQRSNADDNAQNDAPGEICGLVSTLYLREPVAAFIALGANLGDAKAALDAAVLSISALPQTQLLARSALYRSAPLESAGPDYMNAVVKVSTRLPAYSLLKALQKIEHEAGRTRPYRNAPRTLDLDLLLFGSAQIDSATLTVPHPRMLERAFVLFPLHEIAPERVSQAHLRLVANQAIKREPSAD